MAVFFCSNYNFNASIKNYFKRVHFFLFKRYHFFLKYLRGTNFYYKRRAFCIVGVQTACNFWRGTNGVQFLEGCNIFFGGYKRRAIGVQYKIFSIKNSYDRTCWYSTRSRSVFLPIRIAGFFWSSSKNYIIL